MSLELVSHGWRSRLLATAKGARTVRLMCPFIKEPVVRAILAAARGANVEVLTRLNLADLFQGVSDIGALRLLKKSGGRVRVMRDLHSKLYVFNDDRAILTSANLTSMALDRNHEFGGILTGKEEVAECLRYFSDQWNAAGPDLSDVLLASCETELTKAQASGARVLPANLIDLGTKVGFPVVIGGQESGSYQAGFPTAYAAPPRSFVKFFGTGTDRFPLSKPVIEEVRKSGSHWACTFSDTKVPRLESGSVMFLTRTVEGQDFSIYGVALGLKHDRKRDTASAAEIKIRPWKKDWPFYIRVHSAVFVAGTLANGVSLHDLMNAMAHNAFKSTAENHAKGKGNIDPRESLRQAGGRELTPAAHKWLLQRLGEKFEQHGVLPEAELTALDWPEPIT